ncbi:MAG TPA: glycosyltransferase family 9 protein [Eoetvoesiella sp.]|jgi:heptosyltransferase-2|uniref:glycosyltransferase family 9 protein n=1 Tax=Eoetvoesiella sp. TaxID=1966355 RepID=UPI002CE796D3|nr:glycosyltransferase family 9 protein [Eoetvoesiella sp.]HWK63070.1 glycosyltransferase family 9 protein [Eoetvoesiella sp.]
MPNFSAIYLRLPNWIGDVCMSLPSLHALLDTGLPIVACARPWAKDLLAGYGLAGFVEMTGNWRADRAAVSAHKTAARHRRAVGLLLPDSLSSAMVFRFAGLACCGYRDDGRSLILRWPIAKPAPSLHAVQSWYHLTTEAARRWGLPAMPSQAPASLDLRLAPRHIEEGRRAMAEAGLQPGQFILIAPTATGLHHGKIKVWPGFAELTRKLQQQGQIVVMCPPPAEADDARRNAPDALCLPPLKLGAFATLTRSASLVICNDSGVSHVAAAAGAEQLTLFGVTRRERTGPWSQNAICLGSEGHWPTVDEVLRQADLHTPSTTRFA